MKSPLMERPIFHHLQHRVKTHIFLCVLAYHLLISIEKTCLDQAIHTSWATLREQLHAPGGHRGAARAPTARPCGSGRDSAPEAIHHEIYRTLPIPSKMMKPVRTWAPVSAP